MCEGAREPGQTLSTGRAPSLAGPGRQHSSRGPKDRGIQPGGRWALASCPPAQVRWVPPCPMPCPGNGTLVLQQPWLQLLGERREGSLPQSGGWAPGLISTVREENPLCGSRWGPTLWQLPRTTLSSHECPGLDRVRQDCVLCGAANTPGAGMCCLALSPRLR